MANELSLVGKKSKLGVRTIIKACLLVTLKSDALRVHFKFKDELIQISNFKRLNTFEGLGSSFCVHRFPYDYFKLKFGKQLKNFEAMVKIIITSKSLALVGVELMRKPMYIA